MQAVANAANISDGDHILEIGPGDPPVLLVQCLTLLSQSGVCAVTLASASPRDRQPDQAHIEPQPQAADSHREG